MFTCRGTRIIAAAALALLAGTPAIAQDDSAKPRPDQPVLRGPKVKDNGIPGQRGNFGAGGKRAQGADVLPERVIAQALAALKGDTIDPANRLTPEQEERLRAIQNESRERMKAYIQQHAAEIRAIRRAYADQLGPDAIRRIDGVLGPGAKRPDQRPGEAERPKDDRPDTPRRDQPDEMQMQDRPAVPADAEAAKARLREIMEGAPKPMDAQSRAWGVLTESQRVIVRAELDRLRAEMEKKRAADAGSKELKKRPDTGPMPADIALDDPRIPEQLRERLKQMSPEDRAAALQRLKARLEQRRRDEVEKDAARPPKNKPAPDMDEVDVPKPEKPESPPKA